MFNPKKFSITILFMWALAMLSVWANFKETSVLLMACAYAIGVANMLVLQYLDYKKAVKKLKEDSHIGIMMAYQFKLVNCDMVAVFDLTDITIEEVKNSIENDEYDSRVTIMTKGQYQSLEIQDENGRKVMDFCDFLNRGGKL